MRERDRDEAAQMTRQEVVALIRQNIEGRIRPVVSHLPEPEIAALLDRMAQLKFKWEGNAAIRATPPRAGRGPTP